MQEAFKLTREVRDSGILAECDITGRSLKAQMKYADKIGALFTMVIGDEEIENNKATMKCMATGEKFEISLDDKFLDGFINIFLSENNKLADLETK